MSTFWNHAGIGRNGPLCAALLFLGVAGCKPVDLRGDGFNDGTARWTDKLRAPTDKGQLSGLDGRAQEIERNLGVR